MTENDCGEDMERDIELECYQYYYQQLPPNIRICFRLAHIAVNMTRSNFFYFACVITILLLIFIASIADVPAIWLIAGLGIGGTAIVMLVITVLRITLNTDK